MSSAPPRPDLHIVGPPAARGAAARLWVRLWELPDRALFGPASQGTDRSARLRRAARYPYALVRDLLGGKLNLYAMSLVYATLLAMIPLLAFSFGLLKAFDAQHVLAPLVHAFFSPMGAEAGRLTQQVMNYANEVRGGLVGSLGLGLLIWTLISTMKKLEDGFNFVWRVDQARAMARRMAEYFAMLVMGPLLIAAVIGLSREAAHSAPLRLLSQLPLMDRLMAFGFDLASYVIASGLLTALYMLVPNTRVRFGPALVGGIAAGVLWAAVGRIFTVFVLYSLRLKVVYAGFAIIIAALVWTYVGWLILLLGALLSFYAQNPSYLRLGLKEVHLSCAETERLALAIMYLVAQFHQSGERHDVSALASRLGYPGIAVARLCKALESAGLLATTAEEALLPGRTLDQLRVLDILAVARSQSSGLAQVGEHTPQPVAAVCERFEHGWQQCCTALTLGELLAAPRR